MKRLFRLVLVVLSGIGVISCAETKDDKYFNGEISLFNDISKVDKLTGIRVFSEASVDEFAVYDSLAFCYVGNHPDAFFSIYNLKTEEHLGDFCRKGKGPQESIGVLPISHFYVENGALKTLLFSFNEERLMFWNISESLKQQKTVYDTIVPYAWRKQQLRAYRHVIHWGEDTILTYMPAEYPNMETKKATIPFYQLRTVITNKGIRDYPLYKETIPDGGKGGLLSVDYFFSSDCLKPDHTKMVQGMLYLPQINILDLTSGDFKGYRMKGADDFSVFTKDLSSFKFYYTLHADDRFIYALYEEGRPFEGDNAWRPPHMLNIFDWNGKLVRKIDLGHEFTNLWSDTINNRLYASNRLNGDVYYYNLNDL